MNPFKLLSLAILPLFAACSSTTHYRATDGDAPPPPASPVVAAEAPIAGNAAYQAMPASRSEKRLDNSLGVSLRTYAESIAPGLPPTRILVEPFPCIYIVRPPQPASTERYAEITENPFEPVSEKPLSTFSIDADTGAYSNIRRFLTSGQMPPRDAVRIEEMINYFDYDYAPPTGEDPFAVHLAAMQCPWKPEHRLVRIGIKGKEVNLQERPSTNLVFLIDVSGSMQNEDKLPLLLRGMNMLTRQLDERDSVAIVTYAGNSGVALKPTQCTTGGRRKVLDILDQLHAGGSTHGSAGITEAYGLARENFLKDGANRVILCTDGDFNVGVTDLKDLLALITREAKTGVFLTVLGFGEGNLKDETMEQLADKGNGIYGYVDNISEARKLLVSQMTGSLVTIAKDVKIQVEFNPARVAGWRLLGYENRVLADQDFNDDTKDAGEIGAGHTITALYEVVPAGVPLPQDRSVDPLKYQAAPEAPLELTAAAQSNDLMTIKLRYKQPDADRSVLISTTLADTATPIEQADKDARFAASVAAFGMLLRDSQYLNKFGYKDIEQLARAAKGEDPEGYQAEFTKLVRDTGQIAGINAQLEDKR